MTKAILFLPGFTSITTVYETAITGKKTKSDRIQKRAENIKKRIK